MWPKAEKSPDSHSPDSMALASTRAAASSLPSRCRETALDRVRLTRVCLRSLIEVTPGGSALAPVSDRFRNSIVHISGIAGIQAQRPRPQAVAERLATECRGTQAPVLPLFAL